MNNNTFKNIFDANLDANFNIETANNIGKIINKHYNIYIKNLDFTRNKFRKNNEKRQIILKNNSSVNVLLTFFHYNNTNNNWFCAENMLSFCYIKEKFLEIFRKIFEKSNRNSETILKNSSSVNVLLTFFSYNNANNSGNNNWFYGGNMFNFCYIKEKFLEIFEGIKENSETILKNNSSVNVLLTLFPYNNTNNIGSFGENMFSFTWFCAKNIVLIIQIIQKFSYYAFFAVMRKMINIFLFFLNQKIIYILNFSFCYNEISLNFSNNFKCI